MAPINRFKWYVRPEKKKYRHNPVLFVRPAPYLAIRDETFDLIIMLYDSINYIKEKEAILMLGIEIARVLKPGGVFVFDIVTREGLMAHMDDYYETNTWEGLAYQRDSWFESNESIQYNTFSFLFNGERYKEIHEQKIRPSDEWKQLLSGSLTVEATYADFSFKPASDSNIRIHFLCSKK